MAFSRDVRQVRFEIQTIVRISKVFFLIGAVCGAACGQTPVAPSKVPAKGDWRTLFPTQAMVLIKESEIGPEMQPPLTDAELRAENEARAARPPMAVKLHYSSGSLAYFKFTASDLGAMASSANTMDLWSLIRCGFANAALQKNDNQHWKPLCTDDYARALAGLAADSEGFKFPLDGESHSPAIWGDGWLRWPVLYTIPVQDGLGVNRSPTGQWEVAVFGVIERDGLFTALSFISGAPEGQGFSGFVYDDSIERENAFFSFPIHFKQVGEHFKFSDLGGPNPTEEQVAMQERFEALMGFGGRSVPKSFPLGLKSLLPALSSEED
jgi:hypothetical protein